MSIYAFSVTVCDPRSRRGSREQAALDRASVRVAQDDGLFQARAKAILQETESAQVLAADTGAGLDLEGDHLAVVALKNEIHFVARLVRKYPDATGA